MLSCLRHLYILLFFCNMFPTYHNLLFLLQLVLGVIILFICLLDILKKIMHCNVLPLPVE